MKRLNAILIISLSVISSCLGKNDSFQTEIDNYQEMESTPQISENGIEYYEVNPNTIKKITKEPEQRKIKTYVEPQYGVYSFKYPADYKVQSYFSLETGNHFGYELLHKSGQGLLFSNDPKITTFYNPQMLMFGNEGDPYGGGIIMRDMSFEEFAIYLLQAKGFTEVSSKVTNRESETKALLSVSASRNGTKLYGEIFITKMYAPEGLFWTPYSAGYIGKKEHAAQLKKDIEFIAKNLKINQQVVQELIAAFTQMTQQAQAQSRRDFQNHMYAMEQQRQTFDNYIAAGNRQIEAISAQTDNYNKAANVESDFFNPNTGETYRLQDLNDGMNYYQDLNGNTIYARENPDVTRYSQMENRQ